MNRGEGEVRLSAIVVSWRSLKATVTLALSARKRGPEVDVLVLCKRKGTGRNSKGYALEIYVRRTSASSAGEPGANWRVSGRASDVRSAERRPVHRGGGCFNPRR